MKIRVIREENGDIHVYWLCGEEIEEYIVGYAEDGIDLDALSVYVAEWIKEIIAEGQHDTERVQRKDG